jgi:hypothetical protein
MGQVLAAPKVQLIAYADDPVAADADKMITELTTTSTWGIETAEYGVGALTKLPTVLLPGPVPASLDDNANTHSPFQDDLAAHITGAEPAWAPADPSNIYLFLLPLGTNINSGGVCCTDFLGYHYEALAGTGSVPYAVVCDCAAMPGDLLTPLQNVTTSISHELVEAATDPFVMSNPGFAQADDNDEIWTWATGGEIADMCQYDDDANVTPAGATYMIQRSWSDAAAKAGKNPCVPAPLEPYFNSVAELSDTVTFDAGNGPVKTQGAKIAVGQMKTIPVHLFSQAPTSGPWTVTAYDLDAWLNGTGARLMLSLDKGTGSNGDTLQLTIQVMSIDAATGGAGFVLISKLGTQVNLSMGAVGP